MESLSDIHKAISKIALYCCVRETEVVIKLSQFSYTAIVTINCFNRGIIDIKVNSEDTYNLVLKTIALRKGIQAREDFEKEYYQIEWYDCWDRYHESFDNGFSDMSYLLTSCNNRFSKIEIIKILRERFDMSLKDAKEIVESAPIAYKNGM